jgi:hypothetical protein
MKLGKERTAHMPTMVKGDAHGTLFINVFKGATLIGPSKTFIEPWICPK